MNVLSTIKQSMFSTWNLMRWIRLAAGIFFAVQAIQLHDAIAGLISSLLLFQAVTNTGCCGVSGCAVTPSTKGADGVQEVEYEEIGEKKP